MATSTYELRCRECGKTWASQPRNYCEDCFSPLEITYDYDSLRKTVSRELFASRAPNIWRYRELLPLPAGYQPSSRLDLPRWSARRGWARRLDRAGSALRTMRFACRR